MVTVAVLERNEIDQTRLVSRRFLTGAESYNDIGRILRDLLDPVLRGFIAYVNGWSGGMVWQLYWQKIDSFVTTIPREIKHVSHTCITNPGLMIPTLTGSPGLSLCSMIRDTEDNIYTEDTEKKVTIENKNSIYVIYIHDSG